MTEIKAFITNSEITMLQEFASPDKASDFDQYWAPEIQKLLGALSHIVTAPGFDLLVLKEQYEKED